MATTTPAIIGGNVGRAEESSLSSFAGPYVTQMLGKGAALANMPYTAVRGATQCWSVCIAKHSVQGLGALTVPGNTSMQYNPMSFYRCGVRSTHCGSSSCGDSRGNYTRFW
jgi:hypothetical protein